MVLKICNKCGMKIQKHEKGVTWTTFELGQDIEVVHWHWKCFLEWRDSSLENKATKLYQKTVEGMMPQLKGMLEKIGVENLDEKEYVIK